MRKDESASVDPRLHGVREPAGDDYASDGALTDVSDQDEGGLDQESGDQAGPQAGKVYAVLGDRETGKSVFARNTLLAPFVGPGNLCLYYTPNGHDTDPLEFGEEGWTVERVRSGEQLPYAIALRGEDPDEVAQLAIDASAKFRVAVLLDEAWEYMPEGFSRATPMGVLFHRGRHLGITLIIVSQWPAKLDKRVFRASRTVYWFRLLAYEDREWIRKRWGETASQEVKNLPLYHYIEVTADRLPLSWQEGDASPPQEIVPPQVDSP